MDKEFWLSKWASNQIGFHEDAPHPRLLQYIDKLGLPEGGRIFLPLCGKTVDFDWLLSQGYHALGAEFSETAVAEVFARNNMTPEVQNLGALKCFKAENLTIFCGDIFDLDAASLGPVDAIWDRAALVALPPETRARYATHLGQITVHAPQLLSTFDYDQSQMSGPPFAVSHAEVTDLYGENHVIEVLSEAPIKGMLATRITGLTRTTLLTPK